MKIIFVLILLGSVTVLGQQPRQQAQPAMQKGRQVLVDFRQERAGRPAKLSPATERMVLSKVFRKYLTDENKCDTGFGLNDNDHLAAARKAGQIVPLIADVATGSFTAPGRTQTAYVIFVRECNASHADSFGSKRVAIFSGQQLVADVDADFKGDFARKTDLDSDGVDELLMTGGDMNQGILIEIASLVEFRDGRRRVIEDFGTVIEDSCAAAMPGSSSKASVILITDVEPGKMPKLRMDNYVSSCRNVKRWRFLSTGKME
ncbi:MAG TPA: hypothetical protein VFS77_20880 [Pyrinomonadaceae bacterium]|nr:hypothetical protein [Pyrinomonadaceae bacterium]